MKINLKEKYELEELFMNTEEAAQVMLDGPSVHLVGPFRGDIYRLVVNGCRVPHVHFYQRADTDEDWTLCLDDRWEADVNHDEILRWGYVFAQAMAVAAGYTYHGPDSEPMNRYAVRMTALAEEMMGANDG